MTKAEQLADIFRGEDHSSLGELGFTETIDALVEYDQGPENQVKVRCRALETAFVFSADGEILLFAYNWKQ